MIDRKLLDQYSHEKSYIGSDYTSGYNFADKYYVKFDSDIRQYFIFPAGRILQRIYELPKGQRIDSVRETVGLMLATEDTALPETTRTEFLAKLPLEIQNYLKAQKKPETDVINTDIETVTETENAPQEMSIKTKPKHKGGRPRTRETTGRKYVHLWINETEHEAIKQLLATMRNKK